MLSATQLREEIDTGLGERPRRLQTLRNPIRVYTGLRVPRSLAQVEAWYDDHEDELMTALDATIDGDGAADDGGTDANADTDDGGDD